MVDRGGRREPLKLLTCYVAYAVAAAVSLLWRRRRRRRRAGLLADEREGAAELDRWGERTALSGRERELQRAEEGEREALLEERERGCENEKSREKYTDKKGSCNGDER